MSSTPTQATLARTHANRPGTRDPARDPTPSWQSRMFNVLLRQLSLRKRWASAEAVQRRVRALALHPASHEPVRLGDGVRVALEDDHGWPVYRTTPEAHPDIGSQVVFLHGGGYIDEIAPTHWRFVGELTRSAPARCVVPIFPLAPAATAKDVVPATGRLLQRLLTQAGCGRVTVVGNSAGAGLALAAAQWLRDAGCRQPDALVLISPWLDASVSRPEQPALAVNDPLLDVPGLAEAGRLYAGELGVAHPWASPLNGDLSGLAPMTVFAGTRDLLHPDAIALAHKAQPADAAVDLHLLPGLPHNYALLPTPEGREARELISRIAAW